ncbi:hypothetical protein [Acinetobacter soli]|uniref:hypothetical protein n=1 Tax=Acinetobacter soli TaxID=487316 RepID=UPI003AA8F951
MNFVKIKNCDEFLKTAEDFFEIFSLLSDSIVNKKFSILSDDLLEKVYDDLFNPAQKIYDYIFSSRQIGKYYLLAALTYFASETNRNLPKLSSERYLVLQASFKTYQQYQGFTEISKAESKQKQVCDLFRYISKHVLDISTTELFHECSCLLKYYISCKSDFKLKDWNEVFKVESFREEQVKNYLLNLKIIFKRLEEKRVVQRQRDPKNDDIKWPTKDQIKKFLQKKTSTQEDVGYNAKIRIYDQSICLDEDGEIEILDAEIELYSQDKNTKKFNNIISEYAAHYTRHRQRRHALFITNPHYLSPDVLKQIVYVLRNELTGERENAAVAAACILSLLTGLSPVALLNFHELIQENILIQDGTNKKREYLLNLDLKISDQKIQSLKHVRWNEEKSHRLHLSAVWFDYIEQISTSKITTADINKRLKEWLSNQFVGTVTVEKIQAQLYFHVFLETYNEHLAHVIAGRDSQHYMPGIYYGGVPKAQLNSTYLCYLVKTLTPSSNQLPEDIAELKMLQQQFADESSGSEIRVGSQLALQPNFVKNQMKILHNSCQKNIQVDQHIIKQINAYACWMWHLSLLCLAVRPKTSLMGNLDDYCFESNILYVNDKKNSKARKDGRFVPLCNFYVKALQNYIVFLNHIVRAYSSLLKKILLKNKITLNDLFGKVITSQDTLPITAKDWQSRKIRVIPLSRNWVNEYMEGIFPKKMYSNWLRHFDMNFLMYEQDGKKALSYHLIQAAFGHDQRDREAFHPHSSVIPNLYVRQIRQYFDNIIKYLEINHLER